MGASSHPWVTFPEFKFKIYMILCLIGIASASDSSVSDLASASVTTLPSALPTPVDNLNPAFYISRCPLALVTIRTLVTAAVWKERRMGASLLRLHFHDCFVQGCDASVLLNDTSTFKGEQNAFPNVNSLRGFDVIANIKSTLEKLCPGVVSCADILAVAARDSVVALGGPYWKVRVGRRDSTTASFNEANSDLPSPFLDLNGLVAAFQKKNFTIQEMVALSGSHTIGKSRCLLYRSRIYNESNIDPWYAKRLQANCPLIGGDDNLSPLDTTTPNFFDSVYYENLMHKKGLLHSDQQLYNNGSTDSKVVEYATNPFLFRFDFANAMLKMGNLSPLTGTNGQIRKVCSKVN